MSSCLSTGLESDPVLEQDGIGREVLGLESQAQMAQFSGGTSKGKCRPKSFQLVGLGWPKGFWELASLSPEELLTLGGSMGKELWQVSSVSWRKGLGLWVRVEGSG